jgi:hypothetical protein
MALGLGCATEDPAGAAKDSCLPALPRAELDQCEGLYPPTFDRFYANTIQASCRSEASYRHSSAAR